MKESKNRLELEKRNFQQYKDLETSRMKKKNTDITNSKITKLENTITKLNKQLDQEQIRHKNVESKQKNEIDQLK